MPDVSVLMPVYNVSSYPKGWFSRAIDSVLIYQSCDVELCVVDDCSEDNGLTQLPPMRGNIINLSCTEKNTGGADACNLAAEMAEGKYFILLSCRSHYEPESITRMARYLDENPDIGFVYGNTHFHNDQRRPGGEWLKVPPAYKADDFKRYFASSFGYMYRREAFDNGCRYGCTVWIEEEQKHTTIADYDFVMQLIFEQKYEGRHLDFTTLHYHFGGKQMNDLLVKYRPRIQAEFNRKWAAI